MFSKCVNLIGCLLLLVTIVFQSCNPASIPLMFPSSDVEKVDVDVFMEQAVYNGLISDRFPSTTAQYILTHSMQFFVGKCPICRPTENAFGKYIELMETNDKLKSANTKVEPALLKHIMSKDKAVYLSAFSQLILRYSDAQKERLNLSDSEKIVLDRNLAGARKRGMGAKPDAFGAFCPSCDGACGIKSENWWFLLLSLNYVFHWLKFLSM